MSSPRLPGSPVATCSPVATYGWDHTFHIGTSHQALQRAQAPAWRRYGMGFILFSDEEPTTANSYHETRTRRHGQRCPPTPPATQEHTFGGRCHADSMAAANAKAGELRGISAT